MRLVLWLLSIRLSSGAGWWFAHGPPREAGAFKEPSPLTILNWSRRRRRRSVTEACRRLERLRKILRLENAARAESRLVTRQRNAKATGRSMANEIPQRLELDAYSVIQFFVDGSGERVLRHVPGEAAMSKARWCSTCVGARAGTTTRVVVTDDDEAIVFEWKFGQGITFPPELAGREWAADCDD